MSIVFRLRALLPKLPRETVRLVLERWRFELAPDEADLRPVGLITQRLRRVVGTLTKRVFENAQWMPANDPADPFAEQPRDNSRDSDLP